jgi:hypothetical protein
MRALIPGRILAVDIRPRRFGYTLFEMPDKVLDCGVSEFRSPQDGILCVTSLAESLEATTIVLRKLDAHSRRNRPRTRRLKHLLWLSARQSSIRVVFVTEKELKARLGDWEVKNKDEMAALLAREFPVLAWKLPRDRKPWQTEQWNMPIFDAAALGLVFITSQPSPDSSPGNEAAGLT